MQIRQTGQPIPVSKVETDRREEVSKIKPIGSQKIPDSFETGKSQSSDQQSNSSASAAPAKKAGQITGGILIKQMTQARLGNAGIKLTNEVKENTGTRDLNDTEQGQAETTSPKVNTKGNPRTPGATTDYGARVPDGAYTGDARSNMEKNKGAMQDFLNQHNINVPSSGNGVDASDFGVGAGVDLGNGFNGGPQGPGDPMDGINDKFARMDYLNGLGNAANRLNSQMQDATQGSDGANMGHGEGMVSYGGGVEVYTRQNPDGTSTTVWDSVSADDGKPWKAHSETTVRPYGTITIVDYSGIDKDGNHVESHTEDVYHNLGFTDYIKKTSTTDQSGNTTTTEESGTKNNDGSSKSKLTTTTIDANGNVTSTTVTTTTTDKNGNGTSTTTTTQDGKTTTTTTTTKPSAGTPNPENYVDPEAERLRKQMDGMAKNLGMDGLWNLQRGPKNQGKGPDYGPEPVGTSVEDAGNGSLVSQFGKDGLVGNPNQQNHDGAGPSNFGGMPGDTVTDPQEGDPYHGTPRDKEVDVSVQTGIEENVDDENTKTLNVPPKDITKQKPKLNPNMTPKF